MISNSEDRKFQQLGNEGENKTEDIRSPHG